MKLPNIGLTTFLLVLMIPASFITDWLANDGWESIKEAGNAIEQNLNNSKSSSVNREDTEEPKREALSDTDNLATFRVVEGRITAYTIYDEGVNCQSASGKYLCSTPEMRQGISGVSCIKGNCDGIWISGYKDEDGMIFEMVATSTQEKYPIRYYMACPSQYPFGTIVQIEDRYFECIDRMALSNRDREYFDIWFGEDISGAENWGVKYLKVKILNPN